MKKLFNQLGQWVLKYKKKLVYGVLALFIGQICFFNLGGLGINNAVYAAESETPTQAGDFQAKATKWLDDLSFLKKGCYILLYPILVLAGALVNNSMVYAEVFSFDAILWQLWNIVRNLANYALGFLFVFKIFKYLTGGQKSSDMSSLLKSTLIAGIGIQASWFLLAVLIDVSNILTYSVGGLPIHILGTQSNSGEEDNFGNPYVFQTVVWVDLNDSNSVYHYLSNTSTGGNQGGSHFIAECQTFSFKYESGSEELIVAPKIIYYYDGSKYIGTEKNKCHIGNDVFYFNGFAEGIIRPNGPNTTWEDSQNQYMDSVNNAIKELNKKDLTGIKGDVNAGTVLQIKNAHLSGDGIRATYPIGGAGLDVDNEQSGEGWKMARLQNILKGDDGYVGVFSALYSSLLNAGADFQIPSTGIYGELLNTMLSFCHMLAVGIPLLAMLVVFFMRIGVIRMAIILSPAIILVKAFKLEDKVFKKGSVLEYLSVGNLIGIIFSPAIICFAVSISTVLVRIISTVNAEHFMVDETPILGGLISIQIAGLGVSIGKMICSVIGVAISRFLIWTAVQASALGKSKLITDIKSFATTTLGSIPIVPIPGKNGVSFVGVDAVKRIPDELTQTIKDTYGGHSTEAVRDIVDPSRVAGRRADAYMKKITDGTFVPVANWPSQEIKIESANGSYNQSFDNLPWNKKDEIITAINSITDDSKRIAFGNSAPIIQYVDGEDKVVRYQFNGTGDKKYEKVTS